MCVCVGGSVNVCGCVGANVRVCVWVCWCKCVSVCIACVRVSECK